MARGNGDVTVESDGRIHANDDESSAVLGAAAGDYQLVQAGGPVVMLSRVDAEGRRPVLMAGELLSSTTAMEIVGMIAQSGWYGELTLQAQSVRRGLVFDQGVLKVTHSNAPGERLGEFMVARDMLTEAQLQECLRDRSGRRFGEVAIGSGFVSREGVFEQLMLQAKRVFESAVLMEHGHYSFVLCASGAAIDAPINLHLPVQGLLMDSMQRVDEMAVFRERVPSGEVRPVARKGATQVTLPEGLMTVAALSDGERSLLDIAEQLGLDEFETTKAVAKLLQIGYLELRSSKGPDREARWLVEGFGELLEEITRTVAQEGIGAAKAWKLEEALTGGSLLDFFSNSIRPEGGLDVDILLAAIDKLDSQDPIETLRQALHRLASFAMFAAGPQLSRAAELRLRALLLERETELLGE